ncbi:MAG: hypothetical protein M3451_10885 [Chloroflexota bacterium]|nr:hypothetical protein [Chloroflexota bacterium]
MASVPVRIPQDAYDELRQMADARQQTVEAAIVEILDERRERLFWQQAHDSVERLRADPIAWQEYKEEVALFEGGAWDGLEDEDPYYTPEEEDAIRAEHARTQGRRRVGRRLQSSSRKRAGWNPSGARDLHRPVQPDTQRPIYRRADHRH